MDEFALALIAAEEQARESGGQPQITPGQQQSAYTYTYDDDDITLSSSFNVPPDAENAELTAPGKIEQFVLLADSQDFEVLVEVDGSEFVYDHYADLKDRPTTMRKVTAADTGNGYLFNVEELEYATDATVRVFPNAAVTFKRVRLTAELERPIR